MGDLVLDGIICVVDCRNIAKVGGVTEMTFPPQALFCETRSCLETRFS